MMIQWNRGGVVQYLENLEFWREVEYVESIESIIGGLVLGIMVFLFLVFLVPAGVILGILHCVVFI